MSLTGHIKQLCCTLWRPGRWEIQIMFAVQSNEYYQHQQGVRDMFVDPSKAHVHAAINNLGLVHAAPTRTGSKICASEVTSFTSLNHSVRTVIIGQNRKLMLQK